MNNVAIANVFLDYLKDNGYGKDGGYWAKTTRFFAYMKEKHSVPQTMIHKVRKVCHRLAEFGVVNKRGVGSFRWQLNTETWDKNYPFKIPEGVKVKPPEETPADDAEADDDATPANDGASDSRRRYEEANAVTNEHLKALVFRIDELEAELKNVKTKAESGVKTIEVKLASGKVIKLKNKVVPAVFDTVLALAQARRNVMLVGPAGCGKTHLGALIAQSLGLEFGSISCTSGTSENHLLGHKVPNLQTGKNEFQGTEFLARYENGGVFLLDELDAADPNVLLAINSAIANDYCNVPNRAKNPRAERHPDFILIATANTFGRGANRVYAGRNQLDEATLDRFRIGMVECDYDPIIEASLCPDDDLRNALTDVRAKAEASGLRRIVSTRFMQDAYVMHKSAGWDKRQVLKILFSGWSREEMAKVIDLSILN